MKTHPYEIVVYSSPNDGIDHPSPRWTEMGASPHRDYWSILILTRCIFALALRVVNMRHQVRCILWNGMFTPSRLVLLDASIVSFLSYSPVTLIGNCDIGKLGGVGMRGGWGCGWLWFVMPPILIPMLTNKAESTYCKSASQTQQGALP